MGATAVTQFHLRNRPHASRLTVARYGFSNSCTNVHEPTLKSNIMNAKLKLLIESKRDVFDLEHNRFF